MYIDRATVYKYEKSSSEDGSTKQNIISVPELSNIPCRLSIKKKDDPEFEKGVNSLNEVYTLFTSNIRTFKSGANLKVSHYNKEYKFTAGEPILYDFHQEIPLSREEWN